MVSEITTLGKNGSANIFRQEAIAALNSSNETKTELNIINAASWLWLTACALLLGSMGIWITCGEITLTTILPGIIVSADQILTAEKAINQSIKDKSDKFKELADLYNQKLTLYKKHFLTRIELLQAKEAYIAARNDLLETKRNLIIHTEHSDTSSIPTVLAFSSHLEGKKIRPYMQGEITSLSNPNIHVLSRVTDISTSPATRSMVNYYLQNTDITSHYFNKGAPFLVQLITNHSKLAPGTAITVKITYSKCTPLQFFIHKGYCE